MKFQAMANYWQPNFPVEYSSPGKCLFVECRCCAGMCWGQGTSQTVPGFFGSFLQAGELGREGCAAGKSALGDKPHCHLCMPCPGKHPTQSEMLKISHLLPSVGLQNFSIQIFFLGR